MAQRSGEGLSAAPYHFFREGRLGFWQKLLGRPDDSRHDAVVQSRLLFGCFFKYLRDTSPLTFSSLAISAALMASDASPDQQREQTELPGPKPASPSPSKPQAGGGRGEDQHLANHSPFGLDAWPRLKSVQTHALATVLPGSQALRPPQILLLLPFLVQPLPNQVPRTQPIVSPAPHCLFPTPWGCPFVEFQAASPLGPGLGLVPSASSCVLTAPHLNSPDVPCLHCTRGPVKPASDQESPKQRTISEPQWKEDSMEEASRERQAGVHLIPGSKCPTGSHLPHMRGTANALAH